MLNFGHSRLRRPGLWALPLLWLLASCSSRTGQPLAVARPAPEATYTEVEYGSELPEAEPAREDSEPVASFERVSFGFDSARPTPASMAALEHNVGLMLQHPELRLEVEGHADPRGSARYNLDLSRRRAQTVRALMRERGVDANRLTVAARGETERASEASGERAWALDRRTEMIVTADPNGIAQGTPRSDNDELPMTANRS